MLAEAMNIYGLEDLEKISVPPRSRLYHLEPIGLGTTFVESLTSYIARLSRLHCVQPKALILQEVLPLLRISDTLKQENRLAWLRESTGLNGMTPLVEDWVQALERLTFYNTLRFLTMLTWSNVADQFGVVRETRAWCPGCYEEWLKTGDELYEPLIWTLQVIVKCPRHQRNLLYRCPYQDCQKPIPLLEYWPEPGCCPKCCRFLGSAACMENRQQTDIDVEEQEWNRWVSGAVGELIAAAPGLGDPPGREMIASGMTAYIERAPGGSVEALAHSLGISGEKLRGWQKGSHLPQFGTFLRVCKRMEVSPFSFLTQGIDNMATNPLKISLVGCLIKVNDEELQLRLEVITKSEEFPFPSIEEVAKQLKCSVQVLRHKFPELCNAISRKYQEQLDTGYQRAFLEKALVEDELRHLSLNEIARRLGCRVTLLKYRFPELCNKIAQRYRRNIDLQRLKLALDDIIATSGDQPPRIREIALRLGCSDSTLYRCFPDACHIISRKHREWLGAQKLTREKVLSIENVKRSLHQAAEERSSKETAKETNDSNCPLLAKSVRSFGLRGQRKFVDVDGLHRSLETVLAGHEEPFPSVTEVARRLGYSSSTLYHYFPEMCHVIAIRSKRVIEFNDVQQVLEAILASQEEPLPSLTEIGKRVNNSENSLRRRFPELCRAIVQRRRNDIVCGIPAQTIQPERSLTEERKDAYRQKRRGHMDRLQKALEQVLDGSSCPSMVEVAEHLGCSASSLYRYFPVLCRAIAGRHMQQKIHKLEDFKRALEEVLACDQKPFPTMQEVARRLGCNVVILYHHFPELCHAIASRHRPDLSQLQQSLDTILRSADIPPSVSEVARRMGCSVSTLKYYFPEHCKTIRERHRRLHEMEAQRQALEAVAGAEQISLSVNEIAHHLGCSSSVLKARFPELCRIITERRWSLSDKDKLRQTLEVALVEEPPPTVREVARRLDCPAKNIEYYYPDLCKAIAHRHREAAHLNEQQNALEAFLASEEPLSFREAARRLGISCTSLRARFPELSRSISKRYKAYRKGMREARIQGIRDEMREAALLLHSQGIRPNTTRVGDIIGVPARFRMPEAREALREVMNELGYEW